MKILIPMAGEGSRFVDAGYTFPKPLIDVNGKPMIQAVVENLYMGEDVEYIFLARRNHIDKYNLVSLFQTITRGGFYFIPVDKKTEGAACTALLARELINTDEELIIANSDQIINFDYRNFNLIRKHAVCDGVIFCFTATHPKWSFVMCHKDGNITRVAEKDPISNIATCGIYYWSKGKDFVRSAEQMIDDGERVNGEFYIAPTFNNLIREGQTILPFFVDRMYGIGTPEDLEAYLSM